MLSVITVTYQNIAGLRETMSSVLSQTAKDFEWIVIDGGSTDGSFELLRGISFSNYKFISEPDNGIYDAMNKGIQRSEGEYLLFLNAGDKFHSHDAIQNFIDEDISSEIATGKEVMPNGQVVNPPSEKDLSYSFFYDNTLLHQATFIQRKAFYKYGFYDSSKRIVSDWLWFINALLIGNATYQSLDLIVSDFDGTGISSCADYRQLHDNEREIVHQTVLPRLQNDYDKLVYLQHIADEYSYLKNGKFGRIVRLLLYFKSVKSRLKLR